jgi:CMP-N-acetylneuraminic acid synthetase
MHRECDSVISVVEANHPQHWNMVLKGSYLHPIFDEKSLKMRMHDLPQTFLPNDAIYIASVAIKKNHSFDCPKTKPYIMAAHKSIDIDNEFDLFFAEALMKWRVGYN